MKQWYRQCDKCKTRQAWSFNTKPFKSIYIGKWKTFKGYKEEIDEPTMYCNSDKLENVVAQAKGELWD